MAVEDRPGAVELFGEHGAGEQVRPGLRAEREDEISAVEDRAVEPFGASEGEHETASGGGPFAEGNGEAVAREGAAGLVEGYEEAIPRHVGEERASLASPDLGR